MSRLCPDLPTDMLLRYGRKAGMIYCATFSIVGGALLCGSVNVAMFIVARFIAGAGSWGFLAVSKC